MEIRTAVESIEICWRKLTVILVNQSTLLLDRCWLWWRGLLWTSSCLWLQVAQVKLFFMLILNHAIEPYKLVMKCCDIFRSLAVVESRNSCDPQVKWVLNTKFFFKEGGESLSLFLAALWTLVFTFVQNGEYLFIKSVGVKFKNSYLIIR